MKRSIILPALITAFVALSPAGVAVADNPHSPANPTGPATGQPSQEANVTDPGVTSPAGFGTGATGTVNEGKGFANAEQHYAGSELNPNRGNTDKAVSQYDVAGFQFCTHRGTCNNNN
jgi:hypothetical protein